MAKYEITSPSGERFEITAPDDATEAQVLAYAQQQFAQQVDSTPAMAPEEPATGVLDQGTAPNSLIAAIPGVGPSIYSAMDRRTLDQKLNTLRTLMEGVGRGANQTVLAAKQINPLHSPVRDFASIITGTSDNPTVQSEIDMAKRLDAPLLDTKAGALGNALESGAEMYLGGRALGAAGGALPARGPLSLVRNLLTGAGKAGPAKGLIRTAAGQTARGAIAGGAYEATRPVASNETRAGNAAVAAAVTGPLQGAFGPIAAAFKKAGPAFQRWFSDTANTGKITAPAVRAALEKAGVKMPADDAINQVVGMVNRGEAKAEDILSAFRGAEVRLSGVRARDAQVTRDAAQLARDQEFADSATSGGNAIRNQWEDATNQLDEYAQAQANAILPMAENRTFSALGDEIKPVFEKGKAQAEAKVKRLYAKVDASGATFNPRFFNAVNKDSKMTGIDEINAAFNNSLSNAPVNASRVGDIVADAKKLIESGQPIPIGRWEDLRSKMTALTKTTPLSSTGDKQTALAAAKTLTAFDNVTNRIVNGGGLRSGTEPDVWRYLRAARKVNKRLSDLYTGDSMGARLAATTKQANIEGQPKLEAGNVSKALFGESQKGNSVTFGEDFEKNALELRNRLGAKSEPWRAVQADFFQRLANKMTNSSEEVGTDYLTRNAKRIGLVLDEKQVAQLHRLARVKGTISTKGKASPSGPAIQVAQRATVAVGAPLAAAATGAQGGSGPMSVAMAAAPWVANLLKSFRAGRQYARGATPRMLVPNEPRVPVSASPMYGLLEYLRGMNGDQQ